MNASSGALIVINLVDRCFEVLISDEENDDKTSEECLS